MQIGHVGVMRTRMNDRADGETGPGEKRHQRRVPWQDIHGIVIVDKPVGLSSNAVLQRVRRVYRARKAGHTGSLDPLASGVLPLCFGEATKLSGFLLDAAKTYEVTGRLGEQTATGDLAGDVVATAPIPEITEEGLATLLSGFHGEIEQIPPMYSALKHKGKRLYKLARKGETVERPPRRVTIHELELLAWHGSEFSLRVSCSKGTYIRTLVEDIGAAMGSCAHVTSLRRVAAGPFAVAEAVPLEKLEDPAAGAEFLAGRLMPVDSGIPGLARVDLDADAAGRLRQGQLVPMPAGTALPEPGVVKVYGPGSGFVGLGNCDSSGTIAPRRLFNLPARE